jgi:hypothetical protein
MNHRACLLALAIAAASGGISRTAAAETTPTGSIAQIKVVEAGDRNYKLFHGAIWLDFDKDKVNYRWGGAHCKGSDLSESSVQLLFASFKSEYNVTVDYVLSDFKNVQYRCITAFTVSKT